MQFRHYFFESYLFISFFWFCCLSETNSDLVKGVLLGALIARQKSGDHKVIVIPVSGGTGGHEEVEEEVSTTTESSTTTTSSYQKSIKSKNTEIMQSMRQMAEMIQQILGQKESPATTQRPRQQSRYGQQTSQPKRSQSSSGKHVMMMMPVVSMKNMEPMETQNMAMMGSDNIEHIQDLDDNEDNYEYEEENGNEPVTEPVTSDGQRWVAHYKGKKFHLNR